MIVPVYSLMPRTRFGSANRSDLDRGVTIVHIISIFRICPIDIHRRVVYKIDYQSLSTIYIGGLSTVKKKYLCLEMVFIHGRMHV